MDILTREGIATLAGQQGWPAVSIYLPTHRYTLETDEDRIRLKNLLRQAIDTLVGDGMRAPEAEAFCKPIRDLLEDTNFWRTVADGLAIFVSQRGDHELRLGRAMPEQCVIGDRFYLRPLVSASYGEQHFFALALDQNGCRLYSGSRGSIEQVDIGDASRSIDEALQLDDNERYMHFASYASPRAAERTGGGAPYHGHGGSKELSAEHRERFVRGVQRVVAEKLAGETAPLILFGVDRLVAEYRLHNAYGHLAEPHIAGAPGLLDQREIHEAALAALEPHFSAALDDELAELAELEGTGLASHDPAEIVPAAATGRVKVLFFDENVGPFGTFDRERLTVSELCALAPRYLREERDVQGAPSDGECGWDLVDLAAAETALHGGEIRSLSGESPPVRGVAAIFRY